MNPLVVQGAAQLLLGRYKSNQGMFMKNILTMAATGLLIFAGLGWYLDWYKVGRTTTPDGKEQITIDLNTKRIESDFEKGRDKVAGYLQKTDAFGNLTNYLPVPGQPNANQPYLPPGAPNQGFYPPQQPGGYQPQQQGWIPAAPASRPASGGYVFPGAPTNPQPASQPIPGRPF